MEKVELEKEIKKLSEFLSEAHVAHYIHGSGIHIPGRVIHVNFGYPMEIRVRQNKKTTVRVLKSAETGGNNIQIETWKDFDSVIFNVEDPNIEIMYNNGELEIRFLS